MNGQAAPALIGTNLRREARIKARRKARNRKRAWLLTAAGLTLAVSVVQAAGGSDEAEPAVEDTNLAEVIQTPAVLQTVEKNYTDEDVELIAKAVYGEAMVTQSDMEMAAVVWCILNRVDSDVAFFPDTIESVVTQNRQFHGYCEENPVDQHVEWLVRDVLDRWEREKAGEEGIGRILPSEYLYFVGDGRHNHFTVEYQQGEAWDWSLPNPYEN